MLIDKAKFRELKAGNREVAMPEIKEIGHIALDVDEDNSVAQATAQENGEFDLTLESESARAKV